MSKFSSRLLAVTAGLCLVAGAACAQDVRLSYAGLDLGRTDQAAVFRARIDKAVAVFCDHRTPGVADEAARRQCSSAVWEEVEDKLPKDQRQAFAKGLQQAPRLASARR